MGGALVFGPVFRGLGSLSNGTHQLCIRVVLAPDDVGMYTVQLPGGGMEFVGGGAQRTGSPFEDVIDCFDFTVR